MKNKIENLLAKLEFGEVINFDNSYLIFNPDELNLKLKKILRIFILFFLKVLKLLTL